MNAFKVQHSNQKKQKEKKNPKEKLTRRKRSE